MTVVFIIIGVVLFTAALYAFVLVRPYPREVRDRRVFVDYAHRGLHGEGVPENSLAAFELAVKKGYGIELDVQLSRDGEVMVFHDYDLCRMTGKEGKLSSYDAVQLEALRLSGTDEKIPRLSEVLALVNGRVPLLIELKGENLSTSLCEKLAPILVTYSGPHCIESFNPVLLGRMATLLPEVFRGILYTNVCKNKKKYTPLNIALSMMATNIIAKPNFVAYDKTYRDNFSLRITTSVYRTQNFVWTLKSREEHVVAKQRGEFSIFEGFLPEE